MTVKDSNGKEVLEFCPSSDSQDIPCFKEIEDDLDGMDFNYIPEDFCDNLEINLGNSGRSFLMVAALRV